jgi:hypothetical protein
MRNESSSISAPTPAMTSHRVCVLDAPTGLHGFGETGRAIRSSGHQAPQMIDVDVVEIAEREQHAGGENRTYPKTGVG